jgi:hypothetical protein
MRIVSHSSQEALTFALNLVLFILIIWDVLNFIPTLSLLGRAAGLNMKRL